MLSARSSRSLLPLLLVAVVLRSLVADGYMPGQGGTVMLCTSKGMVTVPADPAKGLPAGVPSDPDATPECPWNSVFFTPVPLPDALLLPLLSPIHPLPDFLGSSRSTWQAAGLPPVRAPPALLS